MNANHNTMNYNGVHCLQRKPIRKYSAEADGHYIAKKHYQKENQVPCSSKRKTLTVDQVPLFLREPYILTGYRLPHQSWSYYFRSTFWLHNETGNMWTHAIGCLLLLVHMLILGTEMDQFRDPRSGVVVAVFLACFLSNLFSSLAHLLHSKSAKHHFIFYFVDYAGICVYIFGYGIYAMFTCSSPEQFTSVKNFFMPLAMVLSYLCFLAIAVTNLYFQDPKVTIKRKAMMTVIYSLLMVYFAWPIFVRYLKCFRDEQCSLMSLNHITVIFIFFALDAALFAALLPEKKHPGVFDLWGHSHQWFHLCTIVTQQLQLHAIRVDLLHLGRGLHVTTPLYSVLTALLVLTIAQAATIKLMMPAIERKAAEGPIPCGTNCHLISLTTDHKKAPISK